MPLANRLVAEILGTCWLVFGGCGSAVLAAKFVATEGSTPLNLGIAFVGVSLAFGLTVLSMAFAIGHVSGCHLNPAVTVGLNVGGRFPSAEVVPYIIAQVTGAVLGSAILWFIASGGASWQTPSGAGAFATNGYGTLSPGGYSVQACFIAEVVLTFFFLIIVLGATDSRAPAGFAEFPSGWA